MEKKFLNNAQVADITRALAAFLLAKHGNCFSVYGIPRGGIPVAYMLKAFLPEITIVDLPELATVFVDDLVDSGATEAKYETKYQTPLYVLIDKRLESPYHGKWIVFPWENAEEEDKSAEDIPLRFLQFIGEDPERDGLKDTPQRMLRAWQEIYSGYNMNPEKILGRVFENDKDYDEMVVLKDIEFYSTCEHHALPFFGKAHIAYIPNGTIVGISKLARLVDCFSKRLQVQERLTKQIVDTIEGVLKPHGAGCIIEAQHLCMKSRGVAKQESTMVTSALTGVFKKHETRAEFLAIIGRK
jgi:GTP cyclohydrolase I